ILRVAEQDFDDHNMPVVVAGDQVARAAMPHIRIQLREPPIAIVPLVGGGSHERQNHLLTHEEEHEAERHPN
ncbi:MAG TPA: hypothetical protein VKY19_18675, partial [Ktedonosporobacter sp.]|nr:hypothetical protein [Ktedonosporobacter sp.]